MRTKYFLGLLACGVSMAGLASGCGDDRGSSSSGGSGGEGGGSVSSSSSSSSSGSSTASSTSSGGPKGDGNDSFAEAEETALGDAFQGTLEPIESDEDFIKIVDGKAGQRIFIQTDAKPDNDPFGDGFPDLVITLFDENEKQIAENDDPIPRGTQDSRLYTVLPADGAYYIRVTDFCHYAADILQPPQPCPASAPVVDTFDYVVQVDEITSMLFPSLTVDAELGNDAATANTTVYGKNMSGGYFVPIITGTFAAAADVDVFKINVPADAAMVPMDQRQTVDFDVFPTGPSGNGSTAPTGKLWLTTAADPTMKLAEIDATKLDPVDGITLSPPITFGQEYLLFVEQPAGQMPGTNPFYYLFHSWGGSNPIEVDDVANNDVATPEALKSAMLQSGGTGYFIAGDVGVAGTDVDHYSFVNAGQAGDKMFATCGAQRIGSGLRGLKLSVLKADGTLITSATDSADENANLGTMGVDFPVGDASFILKVEAPTQDANISGTYYQCGMGFFTP